MCPPHIVYPPPHAVAVECKVHGVGAECILLLILRILLLILWQLDAKYMALALNAAVEGRLPSRELVSQAFILLLI